MMRLLTTSPQIAVERRYPFERKYFAYLRRWAGLLDRADWPAERWSGAELGSLAQAARGALLGPPPWVPRPAFEPGPGEEPISEDCFRFAWREFSRRAVRAAADAGAGEAGDVSYYAEKHLNTWMVDLDELPPVRVIVLLRDPRDVYASITAVNASKSGAGPLIGAASGENSAEWLDRYVAHQAERLRWIADLDDRWPVFRYEDLVLDLPAQARRLEQTALDRARRRGRARGREAAGRARDLDHCERLDRPLEARARLRTGGEAQRRAGRGARGAGLRGLKPMSAGGPDGGLDELANAALEELQQDSPERALQISR